MPAGRQEGPPYLAWLKLAHNRVRPCYHCGVLRTALALFLAALPALAQQQAAEKPKEPSEEGIPVTSQLVIDKCGGCHAKDAKGNLSRISWERTTPEGWQQAVKRMVRLNGAQLTPDDARQIVRYLSNHHGLAPEEARPALYVA